ncbi:MAG: ABC transporter ATP-binding protein [Lachnospiraceae bacterium]|nr:ABC transporter ATP-binding protein [Lachnospiraceae bacterium]
MQSAWKSFGAEHLKKSFFQKKFSRKRKVVLKDITFRITPGECVGILGANGCGKSTLLSILAGIQKADSGFLWYDDRQMDSKNTGNDYSRIGYVPQEPPLIPELTAYDNLKLWYCDSPLSLEEELQGEFLSILGISDFLKVPVKKMSGGMKKRLAIGCCMAGNPGILLLDEPGAALDIPCKERIETYLKAYKRKGNAILLTTHEEREINLCDTLYILKNGILTPYLYDGNIHHVAGAVL